MTMMVSLEARKRWDIWDMWDILVQKHERKGHFWETRIKDDGNVKTNVQERVLWTCKEFMWLGQERLGKSLQTGK